MNDTGKPLFSSGGPAQTPGRAPNMAPAPQSIKAAEQILGTMSAVYEKTVVVEGRVAGTEVLLTQVVQQIAELSETVLAFSDAITRLIEKATANPNQVFTMNDFLSAVREIDAEVEGGGGSGYEVPSGVDTTTPPVAPQSGSGYVVESGVENPVP